MASSDEMPERVERVLPLAERYTFEFNVKSNKPGARKIFKTFRVQWNSSEIWPVMREKIRPHLADLRDKLNINLDVSENILVRPSTRASPKDFLRVNEDDFISQISGIWRNIQRGGNMPANWNFEILILGTPVDRAAPIRSNEQQIAAMSEVVMAFNQEHGNDMGELEEKFVARSLKNVIDFNWLKNIIK